MAYAMNCKSEKIWFPRTVEGFDSLPGGTIDSPLRKHRPVRGSGFCLFHVLLLLRKP